ncbi:MAG: tRNA pseudouridine(38-40) synthase TruA [bacterium]|nr:tRNA pseudouridine(38-40) synthase TruA [bacterium]
MRNIKLTIAYDGSSFFGFQVQPNVPTIQGILESALTEITEEDIEVIGAGRTDTGVHAINQVVNFKTNSKIPLEKLPIALNSLLPKSIIVKDAEEVPLDFHARFSAKSRSYVYLAYNTSYSPFLRNYAWYIREKPDLKKIMDVIDVFKGEKDFISFSKSDGEGTIREVYDTAIFEKDPFIIFYIKANGFLRGMVRLIVKVLFDVGYGFIDRDGVEYILNARKRGLIKGIAPPYGLYLYKIEY